MCYKSKGGDTRDLQSRMVPPPQKKKLGRVTLRPVNKKDQRNYKDFSRHAQNIQAVPR